MFEFSSVPKVIANDTEIHAKQWLGTVGTQRYSDVGADDDIDDDSDAHDNDNDDQNGNENDDNNDDDDDDDDDDDHASMI